MKAKRVVNFALWSVGLGLFLSASAFADTIYLGSISWNAAVAGKPVTTVTIPDPAPSQYVLIGAGNVSVAYSSVDFSTGTTLGSDELFNIGELFDGTPAVLTEQRTGSGEGNLLITFPQPVLAFSLNYGTLDGFSVNFALSNGDTFVENNLGVGNYSVPYYVGVTDTPFTSVLLTSVDADLSVNDVSFLSSIPEPAPYVLVGLGLLGLGCWRRNRRGSR